MTKGWAAEFVLNGKRRRFNVAIADMDTTERAILTRFPGADRVLMLPLKNGEFDRLGLSVGQRIETDC